MANRSSMSEICVTVLPTLLNVKIFKSENKYAGSFAESMRAFVSLHTLLNVCLKGKGAEEYFEVNFIWAKRK